MIALDLLVIYAVAVTAARTGSTEREYGEGSACSALP